MNVNHDQPSTSKGRRDGNDNPAKVNLEAQHKAENHFLRRRENRNRLIQAQRQRERQHRLQHAQLNIRRLRQNLPPLADPYDSAESGYWSLKDRRPKTKSQLDWDAIHKRDLEKQEKEELARKEEEEEELDALFFYMIHGHDDDSPLGTGRKVKFPAFLDMEGMDREFKEQLEEEAEKKKVREAREEKLKEKLIIAKYLREQREKRRAKTGIEEPEVIEIGSSDDDEDSRSFMRAVQWSGAWLDNNKYRPSTDSRKATITRPLVTINNPEMMNKCSLPRFNVMCPVHVEESDSE